MTADVVIDVNLTRVASDLKKAERLAAKAAKESEREAKRVMKAVERAQVAHVKATEKAAKQAARAAEKAHKQMVKRVKKAYRSMTNAIKGAYSTISRYAKYAAAALIGVGVASTKMAMDAQESENLYEVSMGNMADATRQWSEELSDALYLNAYEVRRSVGTFNAMFNSMGLSAVAARDMSQGLTQLTYDMASFYNLKPEVAFQKLQAGITGESEPLKRLGILVNETTTKAYAMAHGIGDATGKLTEQEKVLARYGLILEQTTKAQGDMERTLDSSTNVFRSLWSIIKETAIAIGNKLLPVVTDAAIKIRDWLIESQDRIVEWASIVINKVDMFIKKTVIVGKTLQVQPGLWQAISRAGVTSVTAIGKAISQVGLGIMYLPTYWKFVQAEVHNTLAKIYELADAATNLDELFKWLGAKKWKKSYKELAIEQRKVAAAIIEIGEANFEKTYNQVRQLESAFSDLNTAVSGSTAVTPGTMVDSPIFGSAKSRRLWDEQVAASSKKVIHARVEWEPSPEPTHVNVFDKVSVDERILADQENANREIIRMSEERSAWEISNAEAVAEEMARLTEETEEAARAEAGNTIERIRSATWLTLDEKIAALDREMEAKRGAWAEESEAMALLEEERQGYEAMRISGWEAMKQTVGNFFVESMNWGKNLGDVIVDSLDRAAGAFSRMLMKQKVDWKAFGAMFVEELLKMIMKLYIAVALKSALGWAGSLSSGASAGTSATASAVNPPSGSPTMGDFSRGYASGGHVLETGIAKVHRGEDIIPASDRSGMTVNITNNARVGVDVEEDKDERTLNVVINALGTNGDLRRAVSSVRR